MQPGAIARFRLLLSMIVMLTVALSGFAQQDAATRTEDAPEPLEVQFESYVVTLVTLEDGSTEEEFHEASTVDPGDIIEYRMIITNTTDAPLPDVVLEGPVHEATIYLADSATSNPELFRLEFSADGGETFSEPPVMITVVDENGDEAEVIADPELYNAVRWTFTAPFEPNAEEPLVLAYRVRVN